MTPTHFYFLHTEVGKEGSRRFDAVEPLRTVVQVSYTPCSPCVYVRHVVFQATHVKAQGFPILMQSQTDYCTVYVGCTGKLNTF
jgi:hypothetical protein